MRGKLHRYLIVVINTGQIYIMDCLKVQLLNYEDGEPLQAIAVDYPSVDLHEKHNLLLSVSEYGLGRLQQLTVNPGDHAPRLFTITPHTEDFRVVQPAQIRLDPKAIVIKARFSRFHGQEVFITAQLNGHVQIYTYSDGNVQLVGKLNSAKHWPTTAEERAVATKEEKVRLKQMHKVALQIEKVTQKGVPKTGYSVKAKQEEELDEEKVEMITKTLNRVRITNVVNKKR